MLHSNFWQMTCHLLQQCVNSRTTKIFRIPFNFFCSYQFEKQQTSNLGFIHVLIQGYGISQKLTVFRKKACVQHFLDNLSTLWYFAG